MRGFGGEAIIADEAADEGAGLLFDMGIVVLLPRAAAGEGDGVLLTVRVQVMVDELRAVVAVQPEQGHGQLRADPVDRPADARLALAPDGLELDPGGRNIHGAQGTEIKAFGGAATVG